MPADTAVELAIHGSSTRFWIPLGAALFIVALTGSALVVPQLRILHLLQGLIYVAVVMLAGRNNMWGLGAGVTVPAIWNTLQLFVSHLVQAGLVAFWHFVSTGEVRRPDTQMVALGCLAHFILIFACLSAAVADRTTDRKWWKFAGGGAIAVVYFALIVSVALPR